MYFAPNIEAKGHILGIQFKFWQYEKYTANFDRMKIWNIHQAVFTSKKIMQQCIMPTNQLCRDIGTIYDLCTYDDGTPIFYVGKLYK